MFLFGHIGYGWLAGRALRRTDPLLAFTVGTLLPDIIDKPLYYAFPGVMQGTRSLGHSLLFLILVSGLGFAMRSRILIAVAFGQLTHVFWDNLGDFLITTGAAERFWRTFFWPFGGWSFPPAEHLSLAEQFQRVAQPYFLFTEISGFLLCVFFLWRRRQPPSGAAESQ